MSKNESLQKALDALGPTPPDCCGCKTEWQIAITAIKAALEAKDEPYAFEASMYPKVIIDPVTGNVSIGTPQRTWVGLTDEDYIKALELCDFDKDAAFEFFEDKLKELNT